MILIYEFLLFFLIISYLPIFYYQYIFKKKHRGSVLKKLGFKRPKFKKANFTIWVHAVSVGEIKAVTSFIKKLRTSFPESCIIVSSITQTGHEEAKRETKEADYHIFLPFDFSFIIRRLLGNLKIDLVILSETDIWPNFLRACKKRGAKVVIVNQSISHRSFSRLKKFPTFAKWYFSSIDLFCVQDDIYQKRLLELSIPKSKIHVISNLKLDDKYEDFDEIELQYWKKKLGIIDHCLVVGSTHQKEESLILDQIEPLIVEYPSLKILLVPRHPERFNEVENLLKRRYLPYARLSSNLNLTHKKIILIDEMGLLRKCYHLATIAIVAGSFLPKIGGHNILEPLWFSTPCLFGPYMSKQMQFVHLVLKAKAGRQIPAEDLKKHIHELLNDTFKRQQMGCRGKEIFLKSSGGTDKTLEIVKKSLELKDLSA